VDPNILLVFHTVEGQTARIADRLASVLRAAGDRVDLAAIVEAPAPDAYDAYDAVIAGGSIHAVHHSRQLIHYLKEHASALNAMPTALFQVSLTSANPDEEHTATAQGFVHELMGKTDFEPEIVALFAGALVYTQHGWIKRRVMRAIVKREAGDTDMSHDYEYTDWNAVEQFARDVDALARSSIEQRHGTQQRAPADRKSHR
jgi:menaquinone-dependent protoporphyrinogen oxidase